MRARNTKQPFSAHLHSRAENDYAECTRYDINSITPPSADTDICAIYVSHISNEFTDFGDHSHAFEQTERTTKKKSKKN